MECKLNPGIIDVSAVVANSNLQEPFDDSCQFNFVFYDNGVPKGLLAFKPLTEYTILSRHTIVTRDYEKRKPFFLLRMIVCAYGTIILHGYNNIVGLLWNHDPALPLARKFFQFAGYDSYGRQIFTIHRSRVKSIITHYLRRLR